MNHKSYFGLKLNANNLEIKGEVFNFCATRDTRNAKWMTVLNWFPQTLPLVSQTKINSP